MIPLALWLMTASPDGSNPLPAVLPDVPECVAEQWLPSNEPQSASISNSVALPNAHARAESFLDPDLFPELKRDGDKRRKRHRLDSDWAAVSGELSVRDPDLVRDDPIRRGHSWATDETVKMPLNDSVFVFGSVDAANDSVEQRQLRYLTKTGVGIKFRPWLVDELQFRGGPVKRYDETDRTDRSEVFVEVTTKVPLPLLGRVNVEYSGFAVPPVTATDHERLNQNLKFILPMSGGASEFQFGARWWSTDVANTTPLVDRTHLFLGLQLRR